MILWYLLENSRGKNVLTIIVIQVKHSRLLPSFMILVGFLQDAVQFTFFVVSTSRKKFRFFALLWEAKFPRASIKYAKRS